MDEDDARGADGEEMMVMEVGEEVYNVLGPV